MSAAQPTAQRAPCQKRTEVEGEYLSPGSVLESRVTGISYTCKRCLSSGSFTAVWICTDSRNCKKHIVKLSVPGPRRSSPLEEHPKRCEADSVEPSFLPKFFEASTVWRCNGPGKYHLVACEFIDGIAANVLREESELPWEVSCRILGDVVNGLAQLHRLGMAHGCVRGETVMVSTAGRSYLCDFAQRQADFPLRAGGPLELVACVNRTAATDMWEFGILAARLTTGATAQPEDWRQEEERSEPADPEEQSKPIDFPLRFVSAVRSCLHPIPQRRATSLFLQSRFPQSHDHYPLVEQFVRYFSLAHPELVVYSSAGW